MLIQTNDTLQKYAGHKVMGFSTTKSTVLPFLERELCIYIYKLEAQNTNFCMNGVLPDWPQLEQIGVSCREEEMGPIRAWLAGVRGHM